MDNMACVQVPSVVRKDKKKQGKDELDRQKQAEKKKRRLEKALANSAAIRSELEKKKQKKLEEQQRLDEEGAAIAEAVALHVLVGEEDSDDSCKFMLRKDERFNPWGHASSIGLFMGGRKTGVPRPGISKHCLGGLGWVPDAYGPGCRWSDREIGGWALSPGVFSRDSPAPYFGERGRGTPEMSAELIAAQAVSSLQISEDTHSGCNFHKWGFRE